MTTAEQWRPAVGYEGIYSVSDLGRVRRDKATVNATAGRILRPMFGTSQYASVKLFRPRAEGKHERKRVKIHALVIAAFIGPRPNGAQINHKNCNPTDNRLSNLEYVTAAENQRHALANGRRPSQVGEANNYSKLTEAMVVEIRRMRSSGSRQKDIAKRFGVSPSNVSCVVNGRTWKSVSTDGSAS